MENLENILLASDFHKSSKNLEKYAIGLAKAFQSKVTVVHVLPDNIQNQKTQSLLTEAALQRLEVINGGIEAEGIETGEPVMKFGDPVDQLVGLAKSMNANLMLVGSGVKLKNDIFQLGTTAEKIIRKSHIPVWVVKKDNALKIKRILCPVDFSPESNRALKNAIDLARRMKAELAILHVYKPYYSSSVWLNLKWEDENEYWRSEHAKEFDLFLKGFDLEGLKWSKEIVTGDPASEILKAIAKYKSDFLVMGTTGKSGLSRLAMGSVTEKVVKQMPCSFVTMRSEGIITPQLEKRIHDLSAHYAAAKQLMEDRHYGESIEEFQACLHINDMYVPAFMGLANVYEKSGGQGKARNYRAVAKEILARIWHNELDAEINH